MGLDIRDQEPFLGENPGFMSSDAGSNTKEHYNFLVAHYMQNGSLGRRFDVEVRAYDDGVAFRYVIPKSTPLEEILIRDEATEFNFAQPGVLSHLDAKSDFDLPFVVEQPGIGWVAITDAGPEFKSGKVSADISGSFRWWPANQSGPEQNRTHCGVCRHYAAGLALAGNPRRSRSRASDAVGDARRPQSLNPPRAGDRRYRPSDSLELWDRCSLALQRPALPLKLVCHFARVDQKMVGGQQDHDPHPHPGIVADVIPNQLP